MKFGLSYQLNAVRPLDKEQWGADDERRVYQEALEEIEFADKLGFDYLWETEHHFLEEYSTSSAPEVFLAAASQRTKRMRLSHGIIHMPPRHNHPARVAERIAALDLVSNGRVEFGTGEGATLTEVVGFGTNPPDKKEAWEEATRECLRMMTSTPYPGYEGIHFSMPERNIIPKPVQKPHPPVWVAAGRLETAMVAARLGIGALGVGFESPADADERVKRYYDLIRTCRPIGLAINPALAAGGNLMLAKTDEEAMRRGLRSAQYFGFALAFTHGPVKHGHDHVHREFVERFGEGEGAGAGRESSPAEAEPEDESQRTLYRAGRRGNFIGSPKFVRENIRRFEEAHMDIINFSVAMPLREHEHVMETLELFAKEVMPEFQERHHLHQKWREQQLEGVKFPINSSI
jgi:alkanesulfonate monooxygenase SsuD/methylene tetrahydromethanopterin reductase-like flavin-dependent oxidoreductase (luciferase family)